MVTEKSCAGWVRLKRASATKKHKRHKSISAHVPFLPFVADPEKMKLP
jgi:hypothetical protein